ncbi:metal-dependent hydrolase [Fervidibacillus halotolerans]|uniref:Metal-dependent hydrolase n=1 Tax=Fervidibacillus halotolerans TaxID=2980027 RepID=A0A9E8RZ45_9BACI|nr:metal-dependent hydrolase [Fervidibacillus halotolerans]WAA12933.1 metal-dependent hydrolase [Fervidibacillus halotolerans]
MDTGTHFVTGIALGGLATVDPIVFNSPETAQAVVFATIIGSQIPDVDTVLKFKNNASYIRNHRGITHSIPAVILWPIFLLMFLYPIFPEANLLHLWLWTSIAVFLHVFMDIFNAYGTQALRPFSSKWIALGWINTFDLFLFSILLLGSLLWLFGMDPRDVFPAIFVIIIGYYLLRYTIRKTIYETLKRRFPEAEKIILNPTFRFFRWRVAVVTKDKFYVARAYRRDIILLDEYKRLPLPDEPIMQIAKSDKNISAFLSFSPVYRWEMETEDGITEIRFIDLRYRSKNHYPFVAFVQIDDSLNILSSYTGWIYNVDKFKKKFETIPG